jgi:hypothetical protein
VALGLPVTWEPEAFAEPVGLSVWEALLSSLLSLPLWVRVGWLEEGAWEDWGACDEESFWSWSGGWVSGWEGEEG